MQVTWWCVAYKEELWCISSSSTTYYHQHTRRILAQAWVNVDKARLVSLSRHHRCPRRLSPGLVLLSPQPWNCIETFTDLSTNYSRGWPFEDIWLLLVSELSQGTKVWLNCLNSVLVCLPGLAWLARGRVGCERNIAQQTVASFLHFVCSKTCKVLIVPNIYHWSSFCEILTLCVSQRESVTSSVGEEVAQEKIYLLVNVFIHPDTFREKCVDWSINLAINYKITRVSLGFRLSTQTPIIFIAARNPGVIYNQETRDRSLRSSWRRKTRTGIAWRSLHVCR